VLGGGAKFGAAIGAARQLHEHEHSAGDQSDGGGGQGAKIFDPVRDVEIPIDQNIS
jgi:hypothetical protein